jgi:membrane protein implicated in regulation of membrane protease activity
MDLSFPTLWWLLAGLLVVAELLSGMTVYLLMLALGAAVGALAAHLGLAPPAQIGLAALVGGIATATWHYRRARTPRSAPVASNRDALLDIGGRVQVGAWDEQRQARIQYRGAAWTARFAGSGSPLPGEHVIVAVEGNHLLLDTATPSSN